MTNEPGTDVSFSPSEELRTAETVMMKNMQAMRDGSTPQATRVGTREVAIIRGARHHLCPPLGKVG